MCALSRFAVFTLLVLFGSSAFAANFTITAGGSANVFTPKTLTINVGDTVTFVNGGGFHNVLATDNSFTSGAPSSDAWTTSHTFTKAGTVPFYCEIHGSSTGAGMAGQIVVNDVAPPPTNPITPAFSGSWYDSSESGHGFLFQVAPNNTFIAYWFVYTPDGTQQAWILAAGPYDPTSNTVTMEGEQLVGAKFPPNFNSTDLKTTDWGSVTFTFTDCNNGTVSWTSKVAAYGSGSLPITKLLGVSGLSCTN